MITTCGDCPKRDSCTELCGDAEKYVNQDYVAQRHKIIPRPIAAFVPWPEPPEYLGDDEWDFIIMEARIKKDKYLDILKSRYWDGKTFDEIANDMGLFKSTVFRMNERAKKIIKRNAYGEQLTIYKYFIWK